jgi:hypothetical protein
LVQGSVRADHLEHPAGILLAGRILVRRNRLVHTEDLLYPPLIVLKTIEGERVRYPGPR